MFEIYPSVMPICCRCNGSGRCRSCSCARSQGSCIDCLPLRRGHCENAPVPTPDLTDNQTVEENNHPTHDVSITSSVSPVSQDSPAPNDELQSTLHLPDAVSLGDPNFMWGDMTGEAFSLLIDKAYNEIVHYKSNLFGIPRGRAGTLFVQEITRLLEAYNHATAMECVAMKAIMVLPALMLQRPYPKAKAKTCSETLGGRLKKWQDGDIDQLLHECHTIQSRLRSSKNDNQGGGKMAQSFEKLVAVGNIKAALRLITEHDHGGCLSLDAIQPDGRSVKDHLLDKHPPSKPVDPTAISDMPPATAPHPIVFDQIDGPLIRSTVQQMSGSAGPSGLNAKEWKKLCSSFHRASDDLCQAIAKLTRRLCSTYVDPCGISPLIACRLIALDKCPGVRPIGVGETLRRLIGKVVLQIAKEDIVKVVTCPTSKARRPWHSESNKICQKSISLILPCFYATGITHLSRKF